MKSSKSTVAIPDCLTTFSNIKANMVYIRTNMVYSRYKPKS